MKRSLLIVWHSRTGSCKQLARAMFQAARETQSACRILLQKAGQTDAADLKRATGVIFCAPENLGSLSGEMKALLDRTYYQLLDRTQGKACAVVLAAGSDGQGAMRQLQRILTGLRWREVSPAQIVITRAQSAEQILAPKQINPEDLQKAATMAAEFALAMATGAFD
jgi:NAD(P)H-dependent FMN reductase